MAVQVQDGGQVTPSTLYPDIGNVAVLDRVRRYHGKPPVEDIGVFNHGRLVRMRIQLLANQSLFPHQAFDLEAPDLDTFVSEHGNDAAATG